MQRNQTYSALTLRVQTRAEQREAWFLTAEAGLIRAAVFGGPKSSLRAYVAPFHQGKLFVYHNPVKDSYKVTDFDVQFWREELHEQYCRLICAQSLAETILASYASGGAWSAAFAQAERTLNALALSAEPLCRRLLIHFLWNWIKLLGLAPDLRACCSCGAEVPAQTELLFSFSEGGALCSACRSGAAVMPVNSGARRWLHCTEDVSPEQLARYGADTQSLAQAKALATGILSGVLGRRLSTWDLW
jgi:DNA repair protein RecO (recombination protein O)